MLKQYLKIHNLPHYSMHRHHSIFRALNFSKNFLSLTITSHLTYLEHVAVVVLKTMIH